MKPYLIYSLVALISLSILSCNKKNNNSNDAWVSVDSMEIHKGVPFGPSGEQDRFFLITKTGVYEDTGYVPTVPPGPYQHKYDYKLSDQKYQLVKHLLNEMPSSMFAEDNTYYTDGRTDCGINSVRVPFAGKKYYWSFDKCPGDIPTAVKQFAEKVQTSTIILSN